MRSSPIGIECLVPDRDGVIEWLMALFEQRGAETYLGEAVTLADHMLQCATLAASEGAPDTLVAAALLHDVGHLTVHAVDCPSTDLIDRSHEAAGASVLAPFFPDVIIECVRLHVAAKRYLCATEPSYHQALSAASKHSLALQGGPMDAGELAAFTGRPFHREALQVRRWDDGGKSLGRMTASFRDFQPLLRSLLI